MRTCLILALLGSAALATAADTRPPFYLAAGWAYPAKGDTRAATTGNGYHIGAGYQDNETGLAGFPSVDFDWSHAAGHGSKVDVYSVEYSERAPLGGGLYVGLGLGSFYDRVDFHDPVTGNPTGGTHLRIGGRAMAGYAISSTLFLEGTYFYSGKVGGIDTSMVTACLGFWF